VIAAWRGRAQEVDADLLFASQVVHYLNRAFTTWAPTGSAPSMPTPGHKAGLPCTPLSSKEQCRAWLQEKYLRRESLCGSEVAQLCSPQPGPNSSSTGVKGLALLRSKYVRDLGARGAGRCEALATAFAARRASLGQTRQMESGAEPHGSQALSATPEPPCRASIEASLEQASTMDAVGAELSAVEAELRAMEGMLGTLKMAPARLSDVHKRRLSRHSLGLEVVPSSQELDVILDECHSPVCPGSPDLSTLSPRECIGEVA